MNVDEVVAWLWSTAPSVGGTRLVGIDGFSGAGKSTVAQELRRRDDRISVVEIEMFYTGWSGLEEGTRRAREELVGALQAGRTPVVTPWDWHDDRRGEPVELDLTDLVLLEGCGAGARVLRGHESALVWVDADPEVRDARLRRRDDWEIYRPYRAGFARQEQRLAETEGTRAAADRVLSVNTEPTDFREDTDGWVPSGP